MSSAGALLILGGLVLAGFVVFRSDTPLIGDEASTVGTISETVSFYLPIYFVPILQITATALILIVGYLLMRAGYAATSEFIPEKDRVMVSEILGRTNPKEAIDEYVRLRSLTGISGFFTKMRLSGLPLATITLTLIFTVLAI